MKSIRFLISSLLLLGFSTAGFGIQIVTQDSGGGTEDCFEIVGFRITVANLTQSPDGNYYLPDGYPALHVVYDFGGVETGNINANVFEPYFDTGLNLTVYVFDVQFMIDYRDYCVTNADDIDIPWTVSLRKSNGDLYPVDEMYQPWDIFSCDVFDFTECMCPGNCPYVSLPPIPEWTGSYNIICEGCKNRRSSEEQQINLAQTITFSPNPFTSDFVFETEFQKAADIELTIMNTNGKVVTRVVENAPEGLYRKRIFTENWPSGIYFVQAKTGDQRQTHRIVKTD